MTQVVLTLPDSLLEEVSPLGQATERNIETVLADTLEMMWPAWGTLLNGKSVLDVETLSDEEVLALADSKMESGQNVRLGELQTRGKTKTLSEPEQFELLVLIHLYQIGQLRKSEGLAEAARRGLRQPLPS
jgi:hypothetical protein